jgi:hypothetical protein
MVDKHLVQPLPGKTVRRDGFEQIVLKRLGAGRGSREQSGER